MSLVSDIGRPWLAFVTGRISESVTERAFRPARLALELVRGTTARMLPVRSGYKDGGWYSLALQGDADLPVPPAAEALQLRLSVTLSDGRSRSVEAAITGADLARVEREIAFGDRSFTILGLSGAPIRLDCLFDPVPVSLQGVVLADGDPLSPLAGVGVASGALATQTDARGIFRLGPLPLSAEIVLNVSHNGASTDFSHRVDFSQPLNRIELSVPS